MPSRRARVEGRRAVTFIELAIVLVILSLLVLVSAPTLKGYYKRTQLSTAAREFIALARYARQSAIMRNSATELRIDFKHDCYQLVLDPKERSDFRTSYKEELNEMERVRDLGSSRQTLYFKTVESATDPFGAEQIVKIRFFKNGSVSASTIVLADSDNNQMTIEIAGATGAIRVYRGAPRPADAAATPTPEPTP